MLDVTKATTQHWIKHRKFTSKDVEILELVIKNERSDAVLEQLKKEVDELKTDFNKLDGVSAPKGGEL